MPGRILALAVFAVLWTSVGCSPQTKGEKSIHELPGVHYVPGEQWFEFKRQVQQPATGTVVLPKPVAVRDYVSGVDPFVLGFVRPQVCGECHQEIYQSFLKTAHFRTAEEATSQTVLGTFADGKNILKTCDPNLEFTMLADEKGLRQRLSVRRDGQLYSLDVPMHISTGSGNHGQSYLYWLGNELFQLPISYFSEVDAWVNSPGLYVDGTADFARGIGDRCLDCHATFFAIAPGTFNQYDRTNYILGVTCVRCHGPGWAHVQYHQHHPNENTARYIVHPGQLSRERANEVCAQCHSGAGELRQPAFTYQPGKPLADYITLDFGAESVANDDPHAANQLGRLMKSRCFTESDKLTCATCHNPHVHERGNLSDFSKKCAQCHQVDACGLYPELGKRITERCVTCHMTSRRDAEGVMQTAQGNFLPLLRDHYIQAKSEATQPIVDNIRRELREAEAANP